MNSLGLYLSNPRYIGLALLRRMKWLPDGLFLRLRFLFEQRAVLHLSKPRTFQEKIQWLKLNRRKPEYTTMVDKYAVKDFVAQKIGAEYIIPTLGVWDSFDQIDFDSLPDKFVLKTTHGGGNGGVVICRGKASFDYDNARAKLTASLSGDIYANLREWPYKNVPRRIIAEQFIEETGKEDLTDYKFYCFNGVPRYIQVIQDRNSHETIDFYDTDWTKQEFYGLNPVAKPASHTMPLPDSLPTMLDIARKLSVGTEFLRVDLYTVGSKVYFGELTFFPASGFGTFTPEKWNLTLGEMIEI